MKKTAKMAINEFGERVIKIEFSYDLETLFKVKSLPGRRYYPDWHYWSAPVHIETLNTLISWGFTIDENLQTFIDKVKYKGDKIVKNGVPDLKKELFPFQKKGVSFAETHNGRVLIADEQGLGKTAQALGYVQLNRDKKPVVIICPASLKYNWQNEIEKWLPETDIEIISGTKTYKPKKEFVILNYDIVFAWVAELKKINPQILILDEVHFCKASSARRTKATKKLAKGVPHIIALSGTPILNKPVEIYNALYMLDPSLFPSYRYYVQQYCNYHFNGFGWDAGGASHTDELHNILINSVMIRRLKKDVMPELPEKIYSFVPMRLENLQDYTNAENDFISFIREQKGLEAAKRASNAIQFTKIEGLKQLASHGKINDCIEWIDNFLETGNKLVCFVSHKFVVDALMLKFGKIAVKIDGSVSAIDRQKAVDDFQNKPDIKLFVGNIKAAGVGITLTAASNVAFLELPWTPAELYQAVDRLHRIGQKECVNVYYLLAKNTIEEKIAHLIDAKKEIMDAVLDGKESDQDSMLKEIIAQYETKNINQNGKLQ